MAASRRFAALAREMRARSVAAQTPTEAALLLQKAAEYDGWARILRKDAPNESPSDDSKSPGPR
jgi:hypothetical protein